MYLFNCVDVWPLNTLLIYTCTIKCLKKAPLYTGVTVVSYFAVLIKET